MGILKASQKRTKRAPFTEELMSRQPDGGQSQKQDMVVASKRQRPGGVGRRIFRASLTGSHLGLVPHNSDGAAVHAGESHHDVLGVVGHDLEEVPLVHCLNTSTGATVRSSSFVFFLNVCITRT